MKNILFILIICCTLNGFGQKRMLPPWGLVNFGDTIIVDQTEILVGEWLDYIYYNDYLKYPSYFKKKNNLTDPEIEKLKKQEIKKSLLPDLELLEHIEGTYVFKGCSSCDIIRFSSLASKVFLPVVKDSLSNKKSKARLIRYLRKPITGITYNQALEFCQWRTTLDSIRQVLSDSANGGYGVYNTSWVFSLPTPQEFDNLNPNSDSLRLGKKIISNYNFKGAKYSEKKSKMIENNECGTTLMETCYFFDEGKAFQIYDVSDDMQGNAAEMTSEKGVAKGGSYFHYANQSLKGKVNPYTKPEAWLGFRCVARPR
jgi:hypothetical protein